MERPAALCGKGIEAQHATVDRISSLIRIVSKFAPTFFRVEKKKK